MTGKPSHTCVAQRCLTCGQDHCKCFDCGVGLKYGGKSSGDKRGQAGPPSRRETIGCLLLLCIIIFLVFRTVSCVIQDEREYDRRISLWEPELAKYSEILLTGKAGTNAVLSPKPNRIVLLEYAGPQATTSRLVCVTWRAGLTHPIVASDPSQVG